MIGEFDSYDEAIAQSRSSGVSAVEAGSRYVQSRILIAIASHQYLRNQIVFKGGNALDFIYLPNRSTVDLDFSVVTPTDSVPPLVDEIRTQVDQAIDQATATTDVLLRVQRFRQQPPGDDKTHPTLVFNVGYSPPGPNVQRTRLEDGKPSALMVPIEISINEIVCAFESYELSPTSRLNVSTINDIAAEKIRAVLQQTRRNRSRSQDILDLALLRSHKADSLDLRLVSEYLVRKSEAKGLQPTKSSIGTEENRERATREYDALRNTTRHTFIPFDEAWTIVMDLVNQLDIPD